jgi:Protein of unknown function (DUF3631)
MNVSPEHEPVVDGLSLAAAVAGYIEQYVVLSRAQLVACVLWVLHTWTFDAAVTTPYLFVLSAQRQSGKTRLLESLEMLAACPLRTSGLSEASLFRVIEADRPTLMLDEADAIFGTTSERTEPIRGALNSGNREGGMIVRCVPPNWEVKQFSTYCPKAIAGIDKGSFPDTLLDRSIVIRMRRRAPDEHVGSFRERQAREQAEPLRTMSASWAEQVVNLLRPAEPKIPDALSDRAADAWEPLLSIADLIGGEWPLEAREAAVDLHSAQQHMDDSLQLVLLAAIREVFDTDATDRMPSQKLCERLNGMPDAPWNAWGGKASAGIRAATLAKLLRPFGIVPGTVRLINAGSPGSTAKGYKRECFEDAWQRYLSDEDVTA